MISADLLINGRNVVPATTLMPGDSVDLGVHGIVVWYADEDAEAYRLVQTKRAREVRATVEFVKKGKHR